MTGNNHTSNWMRYWRNALADAESGSGALSREDKKAFSSIDAQAFRAGELTQTEDSRMCSVRKLFDGESEKTQVVPVLVRPALYTRKYEHGQKSTNSLPEFISPIICRIWISRSGRFYPAGRPTIPRDLLTPQADDKFTLCDVSDLDRFDTENEIVAFTEDDVRALVALEADEEKSYQGWGKYYEHSRDLFSKLIQGKESWSRINADYLPEQRQQSYVIKIDDAISASRNIINLYDWLGLSQQTPLLLETYANTNVEKYWECLLSEESVSKRLGHSNSQFPLALAQRDALTHVLAMQEGDILAVNGPPGTGKTTFVLSVVASLWIKSALEEGAPPLIIAVSTNNQAVTNIIDAFGKDFEENDAPLSGRWLPEINSYGGYLPASSKESESAKKYQTAAFYRSLEQSEYLDLAESRFLVKAAEIFALDEQATIASVKSLLLDSMKSLQRQLQGIEATWKTVVEARAACLAQIGDNPHSIFQQAGLALESLKTERERVSEDLNRWQNHRANESVWLHLFKWIPPVDQKLRLLRKVFISSVFSELGRSLVSDTSDIEAGLSGWLKERDELVQRHLDAYNAMAELLTKQKRADDCWSRVLVEFAPSLSSGAEMDQVDCVLDQTTRFKLFQLAVHYWEARWLLECRKLQSRSGADWAKPGKTGITVVRPRWSRRMMLTPCIVSTLHSLPKHMTYQLGPEDDFSEQYLVNEIDLLIVDEAGQVSPEIAGASFALAKKALVIGDIHQIEPVRNLTRSVDVGNLFNHNLLKDLAGYPALNETGRTAMEGSVMHIAQRASQYHYLSKAEPGMFLLEHRRCFDEIISFCNDLCYQGLLLPKRGNAGAQNLYPPIGYLHVDGRAETPPAGSRQNVLEANQLASWLSAQREAIESHYRNLGEDNANKTLEDLVGVVTPFRAQQALIEKACAKQGIDVGRGKGMLTIGTVHALQGAERPIVLMSSVYSRHSDGNFIDLNPSMLNVAVSRAKDAFIVFGDMDVFSRAGRGKPRHLLSRYLFKNESNELIFPLEVRPDLLRTVPHPKLINNAEEHDAYIRQVLQRATASIDMVSPWVSISRLQETDLYDEMVSAANRGVEINIYTDKHFNTTTANRFDEQKTAIFERCCEHLRSDGISVYVVDGVHSKLIMADKRFMSVGSFNWCSAARTGKYVNMETSMIYNGDLHEEIELQVNVLKQRVVKSYVF